MMNGGKTRTLNQLQKYFSHVIGVKRDCAILQHLLFIIAYANKGMKYCICSTKAAKLVNICFTREHFVNYSLNTTCLSQF